MNKTLSLKNILQKKTYTSDRKIDQCKGAAVIFNSESLYFYYLDEDYRKYVHTASTIFIDGVFVKLGCRILGFNVERNHGPDILTDLNNGGLLKSALLIGGAANNQMLIDKGQFKAWVNLPISDDIQYLVECLKQSSALKNDVSIFVVSLGLPKQEKFCCELLKHVDSNGSLILPVGAAIDFMTGHRKRSSKIWRKLGLEWLPRLIREPRMFIRNARSLIGFIYFLIYK